MGSALRRYLAGLNPGRLVLWWYFIWYLVVLVRYFDPSPRLWLTAAGLSAIIGTALLINTTASGSRPVRLERWPAVRLYLFPLCVSSFSSLVKGRVFILIFSPRLLDLLVALGLCGLFWDRRGGKARGQGAPGDGAAVGAVIVARQQDPAEAKGPRATRRRVINRAPAAV